MTDNKQQNVLFKSPRHFDDVGDYETYKSPDEINAFLTKIQNINKKETTHCGFCVYYNLKKIEITFGQNPKVIYLDKQNPEFKSNQLIIKLNPTPGHTNDIKHKISCPVKFMGDDLPPKGKYKGCGPIMHNCIRFISQGQCQNPLVQKYIGEFLFPDKHKKELQQNNLILKVKQLFQNEKR